MCLSQLQSYPMAASCIFTPGAFPRGLGAFGGFFDSLIATLKHQWFVIWSVSATFFFFFEAKNQFICLFIVLWLIKFALQRKAFTRRTSDEVQVIAVVQSSTKLHVKKTEVCHSLMLTYKSLLTLGHEQNTNFNLQREGQLYDPSNWLKWHKRGTQDPTGLQIDYNTEHDFFSPCGVFLE